MDRLSMQLSTRITWAYLPAVMQLSKDMAMWRKLVGVEPTRDTMCRTPGLKPVPSTGQD